MYVSFKLCSDGNHLHGHFSGRAGDLPDVDISDKGVKITLLENSVSSGVSPFADLVYGMLPYPKITEILEEV
ncbi:MULTISPECIES: hypothetical protein [Pectobacterium]|uniref:Uncharacterized protein n=1 Tax=Pectobacterium polonicum TaxID=2485124 RepID=A0AAE9NTB5_9GAMM|nr:hypothetical protein [Pectobacterium polonicum]UVO10619.1 hypothetical protein LW347_04850 [Pectobacterium polonicum]